MTVGQRIKEKRQGLGITQDELAKRCGLADRTSIFKIENRKDSEHIINLLKIAKALNCSIEEIIKEGD